MKANELRIGNLVYDISKSESEILIIRKDFVTLVVEGEEFINDIEDLYGIPLTEEWLLKFGFKLATDEYVYTLHDTIELTETDYGNTFYFMGNFIKSDVKYVHSLQNLYFALTGQELEVK